MLAFIRIISALMILMMASGCANLYMLEHKKREGTAYNKWLTWYYTDYARTAKESGVPEDQELSKALVKRGWYAAGGNQIDVINPKSLKLDQRSLEDIIKKRDALHKSITPILRVRNFMPNMSAKLHASYDCWALGEQAGEFAQGAMQECYQDFKETLMIMQGIKPFKIYFNRTGATISAADQRAIKTFASNFSALGDGYRLLIIGHSDLNGTPEQNLAASKKRAEAVKALFMKNGIAELTTEASYAGDHEAVSVGTDEKQQSRNRRVEVFVAEFPVE